MAKAIEDTALAYAAEQVAQEREACAKIADSVPELTHVDTGEIWRKTAANAIAVAIRRRGK